MYPDSLTGKSREYDFSAIAGIKLYRGDWDFLWIHLIGECVNNPQPLVFFSSDKVTSFLFCEDLKIAGIPTKFPCPDEEGAYIGFQDFFHLDKFHHYCAGPFSTQYCSFQQKKSNKAEWLAWHDDEHQSLLGTLVAATEYEISELFASWVLPEKNEEEPVGINVFYPVLIARGDLHECRQSNKGNPVFTKSKHIQFRKAVISGREQETFQIDIVTESYLKDYLELLENEHEKLKSRLRRHRRQVRAAIERIVSEARVAKTKKKKLEDFREILEF